VQFFMKEMTSSGVELFKGKNSFNKNRSPW
jgi:hypothetical protein